jgi:spermidine synthase
MELWFTEEHTPNVRFSLKVKAHLFSGESAFQKVDVIDTLEFGKMLLLDGLIMCSEKEEHAYHEMLTHVPMTVLPDAKKVLVIGGGDGGTVRELTRYKTIEKIDMVEIDKMVVDIAREYLPSMSCALDDPRVTLYFQDGIEFVKNKEAVYDLILVDSTDPIGPGEGLFTREFYTDCYHTLTANGILINQNESPFYEEYRQNMIKAAAKTREIFEISQVYMFYIGIYPSSLWSFGFSSKGLDPVRDMQPERFNALNLETHYYNTDLHPGAFMIPTYVKNLLRD